MTEYGLALTDLTGAAHAAALAAERTGARTLIFRGREPIAAVVPMSELAELGAAATSPDEPDPLLSLCGTCGADAFVDALSVAARDGARQSRTPE